MYLFVNDLSVSRSSKRSDPMRQFLARSDGRRRPRRLLGRVVWKDLLERTHRHSYAQVLVNAANVSRQMF